MQDLIKKEKTTKPTFQYSVSICLTTVIIIFTTIFVNKDAIKFPEIGGFDIIQDDNFVEPFKPFKGKSIGNGVNVRSEPTVEYGKIHNKLYKEIKFDVVERSEEKSPVNIKGEVQKDYWYRVEFTYKQNGKEYQGNGWVYGYFIQKLSYPNIA